MLDGRSSAVTDYLTLLFTPLVGLVDLDDIRKAVGSPKEYMDLYFKFAGVAGTWDISSYPLVERFGYCAEIWTDKKTSQQVLVTFRQLGEKGWVLIAFQSLAEKIPLAGVFAGVPEQVLQECRAEALAHMRDDSEKAGTSSLTLFHDEVKGDQRINQKAA